jgi:hypothetical protein
MISQPVCVAPVGDRCGEGAVTHPGHASVYWTTDINRFLIHRLTLADECVRTWFFEEPVTLHGVGVGHFTACPKTSPPVSDWQMVSAEGIEPSTY